MVELNRSLHHPNLFSKWTKDLSPPEKERVLAEYYFPYRSKVEEYIHRALKDQDALIHLSVHSFTPVMDGIVRNADIGLLYDPRRIPDKLSPQIGHIRYATCT